MLVVDTLLPNHIYVKCLVDLRCLLKSTPHQQVYDLRDVCVRFVKNVRCRSETSFHAVLGDAELTLGHEKRAPQSGV